MNKKLLVGVTAVVIIALIAAACGASEVSTPTSSSTSTATPAPSAATATPPVEEVEPTPGPSLAVTYDPKNALSEGYWYSRYNLGHLVMRSGLGIQLMPPPEKVKAMMEMAGIDEAPTKPYLLQAAYASADPHFITAFNGNDNDFSNFRWDPAKMDTTVTTQAMAYTIIKEIIWAKSFASDVEGPNPMNHFRALALSTEAAAQVNFMMTNLMSVDGLFVPAWREGEALDEEPAAQDQMAMLWALSEMADYATGKYGWYAAPLTADKAFAIADGLLATVVDSEEAYPGFLNDLPTRDLGLALTALSSYVGYAQDGIARALALEESIPTLAGEMLSRMEGKGKLVANGGYSQVSTQATAVQGLVYAHKVTGISGYQVAALAAWDYMETLWDEASGLYALSPGAVDYIYSIRDVGDISGAVNALLNGLNLDVDRRYATFFNAVVNRSGLLIAEDLATGGERDDDGIPVPGNAGGAFGQAPVFATEVVYHTATGEWEVSNPRFTTADAMYASNQLMWMSSWAGRPAVAGFGIPVTPASVRNGHEDETGHGPLPPSAQF
ncbi:MAG: hypothetical protein V3U79_04930 [Dehalococcoidia bacterium]